MKIEITFSSKDLYDNQIFSFETQGILTKTATLKLKFKEPSGTMNVVEYTGDQIEITREGISKMVFSKNEHTNASIKTEVGLINIKIFTQELFVTKDYLLIKYMIEDDFTQNKELKITFKESSR